MTERTPKPRLDHVDAMRPVKQAGVVSTHSLLFFAPGAAISVGGSLMLLHVTREAFLFISACMLTYGYSDLHRIGYRYFYRRRFVSVAVPYVCWTLIYFAVSLPGSGLGVSSGLEHLGYLLGTGYFQLYYLVVIMQFYVVFPVLFWVVRRFSHRPWAVGTVALGVQMLMVSLIHWNVVPPHMRAFWASREITSYLFYLVAGMLVALNLDAVHRWLIRHGWAVFGATVIAAVLAETWYVAARDHLASWLGSSADPFQPVVVPFNIGAIACVYLFGVWLVDPRRPRRVRAMAMSGSDNSYTVYLAQMLFVYALADLGWRSLDHVVPWPLVAAGGIAIVFLSCVVLSSVLARTPLAVPLTGRKRERWSTWMPQGWRRTDETESHESLSPIDVDSGAETDAFTQPGAAVDRVALPWADAATARGT
ncbi:MAG TPA: acyltransferase family protein [Acidimicrobiales bacterium]|nr:acyltransferase family protein [Acidimicrobiales bacterium]